MKNNAEYLESVMKKYGEAKSKRRRRINIITSAAICLTLLISVSSVEILRNGDMAADSVYGNGNLAGAGTASYAQSGSILSYVSNAFTDTECDPDLGEDGVQSSDNEHINSVVASSPEHDSPLGSGEIASSILDGSDIVGPGESPNGTVSETVSTGAQSSTNDDHKYTSSFGSSYGSAVPSQSKPSTQDGASGNIGGDYLLYFDMMTPTSAPYESVIIIIAVVVVISGVIILILNNSKRGKND